MKYYTMQEAAEYLGISVRTLRRWIQNGKLVPESEGVRGRSKGAMFSAEQLDKFQNPGIVRSQQSPETVQSQQSPETVQSQHSSETVQSQHSSETVQSQHSSQKMVVPCDKLSKDLWNWTPEEFAQILKEQLECGCIEGPDREGNDIVTPYWLGNVKDYADLSPLNAFQREILFFVISAYEQGCRRIMLTETVEGMTGGERARTLFDEIHDAFTKLGFRWIKVDLTPLLNAFPNYRKRYKGEVTLHSPILPSRFLERKDKNSRSVGIELLAESPLAIIAKLKRQLLTYDAAPLAIPEQRNTERVVVIKNWLLRRIELIKQRGLNPSILVDTFYEECGLAAATKRQKQQAREIATDVLNAFKEQNVIRDWTWQMVGGKYYAIKISA